MGLAMDGQVTCFDATGDLSNFQFPTKPNKGLTNNKR